MTESATNISAELETLFLEVIAPRSLVDCLNAKAASLTEAHIKLASHVHSLPFRPGATLMPPAYCLQPSNLKPKARQNKPTPDGQISQLLHTFPRGFVALSFALSKTLYKPSGPLNHRSFNVQDLLWRIKKQGMAKGSTAHFCPQGGWSGGTGSLTIQTINCAKRAKASITRDNSSY